MKPQRPMNVAPLAKHHREQAVEWLNDTTYAALLDIKTPVTLNHILQRHLPVYDRDGVLALESVFFYGITDATGDLVGVCVSYAWDDDQPDVRELDYVIPKLGDAWRLVNEITVRIPHAVYSTERARELRVYVRHGRTTDGHVRMFQRFGCDVVPYEARSNLRGTLFTLVPDVYYATEPVKRMGLQRR